VNPRVQYEMSEEDLTELLDACSKPTRVMMIGDYRSPSPQENANAAWAKLGKKMGFDSITVRPDPRGDKYFTAVPIETEVQKTARLEYDAKMKRAAEIDRLRAEIAEREKRLKELESQ